MGGHPKNNDSKHGRERLWKSRSVEKSTKRTFPLRLEIRTHRGFPLYPQPRLLLGNRTCTSKTKGDISIVLNKGIFLLSVDKDVTSALTSRVVGVDSPKSLPTVESFCELRVPEANFYDDPV
jgi:hypothetical protein